MYPMHITNKPFQLSVSMFQSLPVCRQRPSCWPWCNDVSDQVQCWIIPGKPFQEEGFIYTIDEIEFIYDLESFFDFYKVINAKALSKRIGMNQSLLAQYIRGSKKPSTAQSKRILNGVQQIGRELCEVRFLL